MTRDDFWWMQLTLAKGGYQIRLICIYCKYHAKVLQKENFTWTVKNLGDKAGSSSLAR